jgi:hypothetical protein
MILCTNQNNPLFFMSYISEKLEEASNLMYAKLGQETIAGKTFILTIFAFVHLSL